MRQALVVTGKWFPLAFQVDIVASPPDGGGRGGAAGAAVGDAKADASTDEPAGTCAWKGFPAGASRAAEVIAAPPLNMAAFKELDFGM